VGKALQLLERSGDITASDALLPSGSGRPSDVFSIRSDAFYGIGIYIEPTGARTVLVDAGKTTRGEWRMELPDRYRQKHEVEHVLVDVTQWALACVAEIVPVDSVVSIGISVPGFVDTERCVWTAGLQFGRFSDLDVRDVLSGIHSASIHVEDTSRSLTHLQLMTERTTATAPHFVVFNMGIGLGAGVVIDGRVLFGNGGIAGEIGHIPLGNNTNRCACGNLGCTETMLSASGIRTVVAQRLGQGVRSELNDRNDPSQPPTILEILSAVESGDHFARSTLIELGSLLGDLVDIVLKCYTPGPVVLAGEGSLLAEYLIPSLEQSLATKVLPEMRKHVTIVTQPHNGNNEALGAALLGISRTLEGAE
jgi:predicted NBD/HSP70 family sugar kinase